ncbi:hypothetical protein ABEB36_014383 [Hypothenemus hampei]|uniref:Protein kinase domain-containing protein n=1 Tax=Hypothenemus hampei TaxID=57062 RepID=A0ABD1E713_HYPHA
MLTDFGCACFTTNILEAAILKKTHCGTLEYMAPEMLNVGEPYNAKLVDICKAFPNESNEIGGGGVEVDEESSEGLIDEDQEQETLANDEGGEHCPATEAEDLPTENISSKDEAGTSKNAGTKRTAEERSPGVPHGWTIDDDDFGRDIQARKKGPGVTATSEGNKKGNVELAELYVDLTEVADSHTDSTIRVLEEDSGDTRSPMVKRGKRRLPKGKKTEGKSIYSDLDLDSGDERVTKGKFWNELPSSRKSCRSDDFHSEYEIEECEKNKEKNKETNLEFSKTDQEDNTSPEMNKKRKRSKKKKGSKDTSIMEAMLRQCEVLEKQIRMTYNPKKELKEAVFKLISTESGMNTTSLLEENKRLSDEIKKLKDKQTAENLECKKLIEQLQIENVQLKKNAPTKENTQPSSNAGSDERAAIEKLISRVLDEEKKSISEFKIIKNIKWSDKIYKTTSIIEGRNINDGRDILDTVSMSTLCGDNLETNKYNDEKLTYIVSLDSTSQPYHEKLYKNLEKVAKKENKYAEYMGTRRGSGGHNQEDDGVSMQSKDRRWKPESEYNTSLQN